MKKTKQMNYTLLLAAIGSFVVAALHLAIIIIGATGYRYFGAGERFAQAAEIGRWMPSIVTFALTIVFVVCGWYALSGAKIVRGLPLLRPALYFIGGVYTLRGLAVFVELAAQANLFYWREAVRPQDPIFSAISLAIGVCYLLGAFTIYKTP